MSDSDSVRTWDPHEMQSIWGRLGHGDTVQQHVDDGRRRRLPVGGNLAFRRETLVVGGRRTHLGKVNNTLTCGEAARRDRQPRKKRGVDVTLRAITKTLVEAAIRHDVKTIEPNAVAFIDQRQRQQAWFCYDLQLQWLLETNRVDLVVDVGANEGQFGRRLRRMYAGDIISFEPVSAAFTKLSTVADRDPRWTVYRGALGSTDATATIHVCADTSFSSFFVPNEFSRARFRRSVVQSEEMVFVRRLEDVLVELVGRRITDKRLFLKLDTQGYDLEVFKGLGSCAPCVRVMQSELSLVPIYDGMPHWTKSIEAYEEAGFNVAGMFPVTRTKTGRVIEYDCLLARDQSL